MTWRDRAPSLRSNEHVGLPSLSTGSTQEVLVSYAARSLLARALGALALASISVACTPGGTGSTSLPDVSSPVDSSPSDAAPTDTRDEDGGFVVTPGPDAGDVVVIADDASPMDAAVEVDVVEPDVPVEDTAPDEAPDAPPDVPQDTRPDIVSASGRTSCIVNSPGFPRTRCYEYAYAHATEIPVRRTECNRLAQAGNTTEFYENTPCPTEGSSGCCANMPRDVVLCYYPPIYSPDLTRMLCSGSFHYEAPGM